MKYLSLLFFILIFNNCLFSNDNTLDSLKYVVESSTGTVKGNALSEIADYYKNNQNYLFAINFHKQSLEYYSDNEREEAKIYNKIGLLYYIIGNNSSSLNYQFKSLNIANKLKDIDFEADIYNNIGMAYCNAKKYDESIKFYNKSLSIFKNNKDTLSIIHLENNIAIIYNYKKEYTKSLEYYERIVSNYKKFEHFDEYSIPINNNMGLVNYNLNNFKKSEEYYRIAIASSVNEKYALTKIYSNMGKLFLKQEKYKESYNYYIISIGYGKEINNNKVLVDNYDGLTKVFINTLQLDSALKYYNLHNSIRDTIFDKDYYDKIAELETNYNFKLKEQEIKKLKVDKELSQERYTRYILILLLVIILFVIFTLYMYLRTKKITTDKFIVKQHLKLVKYEDQLDESEQNNKDKYKTSALTEDTKTKFEIAISSVFRKEKLYLKNDLTVTDLAEILDTNRNNISQVINERFDKNFNNLINEYRINEAMRLLSEPENNKFTIETISKKVGFNSISVFNTAFKKVVGVTPSVFIKSIDSI